MEKKKPILLLILGTLLLLGCGSQIGQADKFLDRALSHRAKAERITSQLKKLPTLPETLDETGIAQLESKITEAQSKIAEAEAEMELAMSNLKKIEKLKVPPWRKKHATLLYQSYETRERAYLVTQKILNKVEEITETLYPLAEGLIKFKNALSSLEAISKAVKAKNWKGAKEKASESNRWLNDVARNISTVNEEVKSEKFDLLLGQVYKVQEVVKLLWDLADAFERNDRTKLNQLIPKIDKLSKEISEMKPVKASKEVADWIEKQINPFIKKAQNYLKKANFQERKAEELYDKNI